MSRVGVFVCHCGRNIAHNVDIEKVLESIKDSEDVVHVEDNMYMCSEPGQAVIKEAIMNHNLERVVVAACSKDMHEDTFRIVTKD